MTSVNQRNAFYAAVVLQVLILILVPLQQVKSLMTGRLIVLPVEPVDPYSVMKGYYVTLSYRICRPERISSEPLQLADGQTVYTVVREGAGGLWEPVSIDTKPPVDLPAGQAFLKGRKKGWRGISYGIEEFSMPETRRNEINEKLRLYLNTAHVNVLVDDDGNAALDSLSINGKTYRW
ncbi:MAG TPA: GDYXXLXY domain-containing protein [Candidatus Ozemobacteraceae bacterium]|nr:GDYXXLXY domain-containing protein [Candidatus Ozemobacteraceae bacterium]